MRSPSVVGDATASSAPLSAYPRSKHFRDSDLRLSPWSSTTPLHSGSSVRSLNESGAEESERDSSMTSAPDAVWQPLRMITAAAIKHALLQPPFMSTTPRGSGVVLHECAPTGTLPQRLALVKRLSGAGSLASCVRTGPRP